jgi:hypothetical protein
VKTITQQAIEIDLTLTHLISQSTHIPTHPVIPLIASASIYTTGTVILTMNEQEKNHRCLSAPRPPQNLKLSLTLFKLELTNYITLLLNAFCFFFWKNNNTPHPRLPLGACPQTPGVGFAEFRVKTMLLSESRTMLFASFQERIATYRAKSVPGHTPSGPLGRLCRIY